MLIVIPVVVLLLASLGGFVYGAVVFVQSLRDVVRHPIPVGNTIGLFLLVVGALTIFVRFGSHGERDRAP